jgi:hypothetical protein
MIFSVSRTTCIGTDLESLFYVIIYVISGYHDGRRIDKHPLRHWDQEGENALKRTKITFFFSQLPEVTPHFKDMEKLADELKVAISQGIQARNLFEFKRKRAMESKTEIPTFDAETLDDHVSFKTFRDIFSRKPGK